MNGILLPSIVSTIRSLKDGSVSVCLETQELSPMKAGEIFSLRKKVVMAYFSEKETIPQKELDQVDSINPDLGGKTPSQRLRNVLYVAFEQNHEGYKDFDSYYRGVMEKIIEHYKSKLQ